MAKNNLFLKVISLDVVNSTNDYAFHLARQGKKEITVISVRAQSAGRGRAKRPWHSPRDKGIYVSFILRPRNPIGEIIFLPLIFSYGVVKTINSFVEARIKWPNDVLVSGKKIAGVLVEARGNKTGVDFAIVGVGININAKLKEIPQEATSLFIEAAKTYDVKELLRKLIQEEISLYRDFINGKTNNLLEKVAYFLYNPAERAKIKKIAKNLKDNFIKEMVLLR